MSAADIVMKWDDLPETYNLYQVRMARKEYTNNLWF